MIGYNADERDKLRTKIRYPFATQGAVNDSSR